MERSLFRHSFLFGLLALVWAACCSTSEAQFLDKLEAAVRAQLEKSQQSTPQDAPAPSTEELPAPAVKSSDRRPPADPQPISPTNEIPSILEMTPSSPLVVPNPVDGSNSGLPVDAADKSAGGVTSAEESINRIYLGLEAEDPVGGGIGVRVTAVSKDSPAWKSGFKVGDQILAINGFAIANLNGMVEQLAKTLPGDSVRFLTRRGGRNMDLVSVLQNAAIAGQIEANELASSGTAWLGVVVNDLTSAFRQQFGVGIFRGAAVTNVSADSPAAMVGIKAGDVIAEVDGLKIESAAQLMDVIAKAQPGDVLRLQVAQGGFVKPMVVTLANQDRPVPLPRRASRINSSQTAPQDQAAAARPTRDADSTAREEQLLQEIARLQAELDAANERIAETEQRLNAIIESLNRNR